MLTWHAAMQSFLVAVVIPEKKDIQSFAKQQCISGDYSDLLTNDKVSWLCNILLQLFPESGQSLLWLLS